MRERHKTGSVVFDRGNWRFLQWVDGKRRSQTIGTKQEYPTKASAWNAVKRLPDVQTNNAVSKAPAVNTLVEQYRREGSPERHTRRPLYAAPLGKHNLP